MNLSDLMAEEEAKRRAEAQAEIAAEKAAWDTMTPEQQAAVIAEREAKWERLEQASAESDDEEVCPGCGEPDCDFDCDGDYDGDEDNG